MIWQSIINFRSTVLVLVSCIKLRVNLAPEDIKLFSCSTQLITKFQLLIKTKILTIKKFLALSLSDVVLIMLINVKMPTIVGILALMSRINSCLAELSTKKVL